jgi:hypothetical protein
MKRFRDSIERSLMSENWYGALSMALMLPDICGGIETPEKGSKARYIDWFNRYLLNLYTAPVGIELRMHVFLHGEDCYALRCSYLHEGGAVIVAQKARKALDAFHFVAPPPNGNQVHMNQRDNALQLQVDIFCREVCAAVAEWVEDVVRGNAELEARLGNLLVIHELGERIRL